MKLYTKYIYLMAAAICAAFTSCDNISADDRFIELPAVEAKRVVLLEEFTGQLCVNCPDAHLVIEKLLNQYPDALISVSLHGGGDAFSISEEKMPGVGLRNQESQAYCDAYNIAALPAGVVNRTSGVLNADQWAGAVYDELKRPSNINIDVTATLSADGTSIEINTNLQPYDNIEANLQLWVVESGIVAMQRKPSTTERDYVHNHVFRASANGHDGQPLKLVINQPQSVDNQVAVNPNWNTDNLSIVAFVYNASGVLQAAQAHLVSAKH